MTNSLLCNDCGHKNVCRHINDFEEFYGQIETIETLSIFSHEIHCKHFTKSTLIRDPLQAEIKNNFEKVLK